VDLLNPQSPVARIGGPRGAGPVGAQAFQRSSGWSA